MRCYVFLTPFLYAIVYDEGGGRCMKYTHNQHYVDHHVNASVVHIKAHQFLAAKKHLMEILYLDDCTPIIHNLLGIIHEKQGQIGNAMRHYRCAYVLDGTYRPAIENLVRCSEGRSKDVNYGEGVLTFDQRKKLRSQQDEKN